MLSTNRAEKLMHPLKTMPLMEVNLDGVFYIFALRVNSERSTGKRKLIPGHLYYFLEGFSVLEDRVLVSKSRFAPCLYDYDVRLQDSSAPHVSISAVVGENGSGKSSLVEFEMRLINNFSAVVFGEFAREAGREHLHYIDGVQGELFFAFDKDVCRLAVSKRIVTLDVYHMMEEEEDGYYVFKKRRDAEAFYHQAEKGKPIHSHYQTDYFESIKELLRNFFYTVIINQSSYAYNTNDYRDECNAEKYEILVRKTPKMNYKGVAIPYDVEEKCWLNGLFHHNDGYQVPLVLSPNRIKGNYDINRETEFAYERLITNMLLADESDRIINGHLKVDSIHLVRKHYKYDVNALHDTVGYRQFSKSNFEKMKKCLIIVWSKFTQYDILGKSSAFFYRTVALNYLVYKTLKIAAKYDAYHEFRSKYYSAETPFNEEDFNRLVTRTIADKSHVTKKLYRTIAYLLWGVYEKKGGGGKVSFTFSEIKSEWIRANDERPLMRDVEVSLTLFSLLEAAAYPPPFFEMSIGLVDLDHGICIPFEGLSSGEKQQAFTISSVVYQLKNLDSVYRDLGTTERVVYKYVQLILEEVEMYYHPDLQRTFVKNLIEGIKHASLSSIKWVSISIVTHSPFVLSDIPAENVLALRKDEKSVEKIQSFGANIHEMLRLSFFLENGTMGAFSSWTIKRIAKCLNVSRWLSGREAPPAFFPSLVDVPDEYEFLNHFKVPSTEGRFNAEAFSLIYSPEILLRQIEFIAEPIIRRTLLEDYKLTFPENNDDYKTSMLRLLESQIAKLK